MILRRMLGNPVPLVRKIVGVAKQREEQGRRRLAGETLRSKPRHCETVEGSATVVKTPKGSSR